MLELMAAGLLAGCTPNRRAMIESADEPTRTSTGALAEISTHVPKDSASCVELVNDWLAKGAELGLGNNNMDYVEGIEALAPIWKSLS